MPRSAQSDRHDRLASQTLHSFTSAPTTDNNTELLVAYDAISADEERLLSSPGIRLPNARGQQLIRDLATSWSSHSGAVDCILLGKDITDEDLERWAASWSRKAGPGPNFSRLMINSLRGRDAEVEATTRQEVAEAFFAFTNLYHKDRSFVALFEHIALLSRRLRLIQARVGCVESGRVSYNSLMRSHYPADMIIYSSGRS